MARQLPLLTLAIISLHILLLGQSQQLSPCQQYGDTYGSWQKVVNVTKNGTDFSSLREHFHDGFIGEALNFTHIWITDNCSYRRFNSVDIHNSVRTIIHSRDAGGLHPEPNATIPVEIIFVGDSALRGIFCGIGRILLGSELLGPNMNVVCGGVNNDHHGKPISSEHTGVPYSVDYHHLKLTFMYSKSFMHAREHLGHKIENDINRKPHAIVVNSGAWDFDAISRSPNFTTKSQEECMNNASIDVSKLRASQFVNDTILELNVHAKANGVRMIYRNNHYNARFGTICADEKFQNLLNGTDWEVWDNRRMSKESWVEQTYDGFHFDRTLQFSPQDHVNYRGFCLGKGWEAPGQLEMQLAQSLLNTLFYKQS